jgi:hypothetical protein
MCHKASVLGEEWSVRTYPRRFNATLKMPSLFKGPPSEAVDEAWEQIKPRE